MSTRRVEVVSPSFFAHLVYLWRLRIDIALNRSAGRRRILALVSFVFSISPAIPLAWGTWWVMTWDPVARSDIWSRLFFDLLTFVATCVWLCWPILSAGVDDHSEITRYRTLPITSFRLLFASTFAGLLEPLAIVIYAPVVAAAAGMFAVRPPSSWSMALVLFLAWVVFAVAWSRAGLHLLLNVLRRQKSAQAIGGFFLFVLAISFVIPPVDVSWLTAVGEAGFGGMTPEFALQAAVGLSRVPTGYLGEGLRALGEGHLVAALLELGGLLFFAWVGLFFAYRLLLRFHREDAVQLRLGQRSRGTNPFESARTRHEALIYREAIDLWRNPRARLLAFVPLVLAVAIKLLSGRILVRYVVGDAVDAWLLGGLALYGVIVFSLTFSQNMFGYDGRGLATMLASPVPLSEAVTAKNLVHGTAGFSLAVINATFYVLYFRAGGLVEWAAALAASLCLIPALLTVGNIVSVVYATRFHASLERRDQQPRAAILAGIVATSVGAGPYGLSLRLAGEAGPSWLTVAFLVGVAGLYWVAYRVSLPFAMRFLEARREAVLHAVTQD